MVINYNCGNWVFIHFYLFFFILKVVFIAYFALYDNNFDFNLRKVSRKKIASYLLSSMFMITCARTGKICRRSYIIWYIVILIQTLNCCSTCNLWLYDDDYNHSFLSLRIWEETVDSRHDLRAPPTKELPEPMLRVFLPLFKVFEHPRSSLLLQHPENRNILYITTQCALIC